MNKVKVGIVGCGQMAEWYHVPCLLNFEDVEISLCDAWKKPNIKYIIRGDLK